MISLSLTHPIILEHGANAIDDDTTLFDSISATNIPPPDAVSVFTPSSYNVIKSSKHTNDGAIRIPPYLFSNCAIANSRICNRRGSAKLLTCIVQFGINLLNTLSSMMHMLNESPHFSIILLIVKYK